MIAFHSFQRLWIVPLLLVAVSGAVTPLAGGQPAVSDRQLDFDIPAQPLDGALAAYFRVTGVQLLYDSRITSGRRSSAVSGSYSPREALRRILAGTGLIARYSRSNAAIIVAAETTSNTPLVSLGRVVVRERMIIPSPTDRLAYYNTLEDALQARLSNDETTSRLAFSVRVSIRIYGADNLSTATISDIRIDRSSGSPKTDRMLMTMLGGAPVPKPPEGLLQPLVVALKGKRR